MLVLSRKVGEKLIIGGGTPHQITLIVSRMVGNRVTLAIDAPRETRIVRAELVPDEGGATTERQEEVSHTPPPAYRHVPPPTKYTQCSCGLPLTKGQRQCKCGRGTPVGT